MNNLELGQMKGGIMVMIPHQDDEVLLCGGVLYQAKKLGLDIKAVIVTNGDCGCSDQSKGQMRLRETIRGMQTLGIGEQDMIFLGYADTGMPRQESFLWKLYQEKDQKKVIASDCGNTTYALPEKEEYHKEVYGEHAVYTREMVKEDLRSVLFQYRPACIFTTSEEDTHGDHAGLYLFLREILKELEKEDYHPEVFCGLVHSQAGDDVWPERTGERFTCPKDLDRNGGLIWGERYCFMLPEEMKLEKGRENLKYQALLQYETALEPEAYDFLMSFIKDEEIFWKMKE